MTMKLIQTQTLATAAASITFTSIPQDGTDLVILVSARTDRSLGVDSINANINGSSADFTNRQLIGDGGVASSNTVTNPAIALAADSLNTASTFGNSVAYITNYTGSTFKSISADAVTENNAAGAYQNIRAVLWSNTAAITSITFVPNVGPNILAGSTISLYKITKGSDGIVTTS